MTDVFAELYDRIAARKGEATSPHSYDGGNGRIDRAVDLLLGPTELLQDVPGRDLLVDVGGATGNLGYVLRDVFAERIVLDIVEDCRAPAESKGNEFMCFNVDQHGLMCLRNCCTDLVVALDFIEHILDPEKFARECFRVLKPGGLVLLNTPNIQFWRHLESLVVHGYFPHTSGDNEVYHGGHTAFFNRQDLEHLFSSAGFQETRVHTQGLPTDPPPPIWLTLGLYPDKGVQLSYADLVMSARKPR